MIRRKFLKSISLFPAFVMLPSLSSATEITTLSDGSDVAGLDRIIEIIENDERLNRRVDSADISIAIDSAKRMNEIIIEAIIQTGAGNDRKISIADTREINDYIFHNYNEEWIELHGDDEENEETGFHLVVNDGARTKIFGKNAINSVADSIYHLGFDTHLKNRLLNEDGNKNASYKKVALWLDSLLKDDLEAGRLQNSDIREVVGNSGTGLDKVIEIIYNDEGLQRRISIGDMRIGARSANIMNELLLEAIDETNAGATGVFTLEDMQNVNHYLVLNHAELWAEVHGDDEDDKESGYHKVQNDGAKTKLFGKNAINRVFDGIYHLGFKTPYTNIVVNEDGDRNSSFKIIALWLNELLADDLVNQQDDLKILIPLYIYPKEGAWQSLIDTKTKYPDIEITAIINPSNGHFSEKNSDYSRAIKELKDANIKTVGYVYSKYGERDSDEVIADIDAWSQFYKEDGISGIFFDETSTDANLLDYYSNLSHEAEKRELVYTILNAGITTDQSYIDSGIFNVVVTYENPHEKLLSNPPSTYNEPSETTNLSLLVYGMQGDSVDELISFAREHKFSTIYFTEDGFNKSNNPWNTISSYIEDEASKSLV